MTKGRKQKPPVYKSGDVVGNIKILQCIGRSGSKMRWWAYDCQCILCGSVMENIREDRISDGSISMCWLCKVNEARKRKAAELKGQNFGTWEITDAVPRSKGQHLMWEARCRRCGAVKHFRLNQLKNNPKCINCIRKGSKRND